MALKFRRGTTAQQSGSLAFGEPFVNTTLGTLLVGGATGDITLAVAGTGSVGTFGAISGSGLDITGNANIAGNLTLGGTITIGDASTDNVVVNADLSSSIIPNNDNAFDLGSSAARYRAIYGTNIYGAINATNGVVSGSSQVTPLLPAGTVSGSVQVTLGATSGFSTYNTALQTITGSLVSTASANTISITNINTVTASALTRFTNLETTTASLNTSVSNLNTFSASENSKAATLATYTGSVDSKFTTIGTVTASYDGRFTSLATVTGSLISSASNANGRLNAIEAVSGTFARTNSANTFNGTQTVSGSLFVTQDLVVQGSSSIQNISSSNLVIGASLVTLNTNTPSSRYAGLNIIDSGSSGGSASLWYDAVQDEFIQVHRGNGINITSSHFVQGPQTFDNLGNEAYLTNNRLVKGTGLEHIVDSNITDTGTEISLNSLTSVTGSLRVSNAITASSGILNGTLTLSGDLPRLYLTDTVHNNDYSIINTDGTFTIYDDTLSIGKFKIYTTGLTEITGPLSVTGVITGSIAATNGVISGSSQVVGSSITTNTVTLNGQSVALGGTATIANLVSGSSQITAASTTGFATGVKTQLDANTVVSGSSQVIGILSSLNTYTGSNDTTNASQNTSISNLNTYTSSFAAASVTLTNKTISGASNTLSNIANASLTNSSVTVTAGTGMSGGGAVSLGGSVTLTNAGVTSAVAGTGVTVSGATGAVTISIGQSVATTATPTFGNLTINGTITATGDITAFFTSDKRHKNNIQTISNAVLKVKQLNGVTWEWNDDVNEVTKSTPKTGLIAQEVQQVLPQVVIERENGFLALDYSKMVGLLVEAIKEQQIQIDQLKAQIGSK
jgi:cytoskeletal protein CcmA (bactofilin family)